MHDACDKARTYRKKVIGMSIAVTIRLIFTAILFCFYSFARCFRGERYSHESHSPHLCYWSADMLQPGNLAVIHLLDTITFWVGVQCHRTKTSPPTTYFDFEFRFPKITQRSQIIAELRRAVFYVKKKKP